MLTPFLTYESDTEYGKMVIWPTAHRDDGGWHFLLNAWGEPFDMIPHMPGIIYGVGEWLGGAWKIIQHKVRIPEIDRPSDDEAVASELIMLSIIRGMIDAINATPPIIGRLMALLLERRISETRDEIKMKQRETARLCASLNDQEAELEKLISEAEAA
jgi:hypothetical protein